MAAAVWVVLACLVVVLVLAMCAMYAIDSHARQMDDEGER